MPQRIEIACPTCGLIAEVERPRSASLPRLCSCPGPRSTAGTTRPRLCICCSTRLNRYNRGTICGPCARTREKDAARV